jgi:hypothetical protein
MNNKTQQQTQSGEPIVLCSIFMTADNKVNFIVAPGTPLVLILQYMEQFTEQVKAQLNPDGSIKADQTPTTPPKHPTLKQMLEDF